MAQPQETPGQDPFQLSLFPLNLVLFPGMALPLHIFEERYKAMIGDCLDRKEPFGIVLIKEGREVGEPAEPFRIGTTARIVQAETLEEGRLNILTRGEHRFELVEITQQLPHLAGQVKILDEDPGDEPSGVTAEITEGYSSFLRNLTALAGGWTARAQVPDDPVQLSFAVAASLATSIDIPSQVRQQLLEAATAKERLDLLLEPLNRGNEVLAAEVEKRNPYRGPRLN